MFSVYFQENKSGNAIRQHPCPFDECTNRVSPDEGKGRGQYQGPDASSMGMGWHQGPDASALIIVQCCRQSPLLDINTSSILIIPQL